MSILFVSILFILSHPVKTSFKWKSCPQYSQTRSHSENTYFFIEELVEYNSHAEDKYYEPNYESECSIVTRPLNYENSTNHKTIGIFVKRYPSGNNVSDILWILPDFPGSSMIDMEEIVMKYADILPNFDIYYMEPRGVGRSTRIGCVISGGEEEGSYGGIEIVECEVESCKEDFMFQYDEKEFSVTQSAMDLLEIMKLVNLESGRTYSHHLLGIGYGTYLTSRLLQIVEDHPFERLDTVILDSSYSQGDSGNNENVTDRYRYRFDQMNKYFEKVGLAFFSHCMNSTFCKKKLSSSKTYNLTKMGERKFVETIINGVFVNGTGSICYKIRDIFSFSQTKFKVFLGNLLKHYYYREFIPALFYRIIRCQEYSDFGVFEKMQSILNGASQSKELKSVPYNSIIHSLHLIYNEFYTYPHPLNPTGELISGLRNVSFSGISPFIGNYLSDWPIYSDADPYFQKSFKMSKIGDVNLLMIQGRMDPITPLEIAQDQYRNIGNSPNSIFVIIPFATHNTQVNSKVETPKTDDCGMQIATSFLKGNGTVVDLDCLSDLRRMGYGEHVGRRDAEYLFGCYKDIFDCVYVERDKNLSVSLQVFVICEISTVIVALSIISLLLYCCCVRLSKKTDQLKKRGGGYQKLGDESEEEDAEEDEKIYLIE